VRSSSRSLSESHDQLKQDEIRDRGGHGLVLRQHLPRGTKLRLTDVKELFLQMRDHAWSCWLVMHEDGTYVRFTPAGAELFA
jgi:hypothetical protein